MLKKTQHLQLPEDPFTRDQILEDVGHLFECNSLSISRIRYWPAEQKVQNITLLLVHVLFKSYHSHLRCWVKTMQKHHMETKVLSKRCHTLHSRACIKCSMITLCLQYTHTHTPRWAWQLLSGSAHTHPCIHCQPPVYSQRSTAQLRSRCDHKHLHIPRKTLLQVKCLFSYIDLIFPKRTNTVIIPLWQHHAKYRAITPSFCISRSNGTRHLSSYTRRMGMTPGFLSKCLCDASTVVISSIRCLADGKHFNLK